MLRTHAFVALILFLLLCAGCAPDSVSGADGGDERPRAVDGEFPPLFLDDEGRPFTQDAEFQPLLLSDKERLPWPDDNLRQILLGDEERPFAPGDERHKFLPHEEVMLDEEVQPLTLDDKLHPLTLGADTQLFTPGDIERLARNYKLLKLMIPKPVRVKPELSFLCSATPRRIVDAPRVNRGPHAHCIAKFYMNELAAGAFEAHTKYPVGAVIIKEKLMFGIQTKHKTEWDITRTGVGGMIKRSPGFDPDHGDWEYFYFEKADDIEAGRIQNCIQCHAKAKNTDFVYGTWSFESREFGKAYNWGY